MTTLFTPHYSTFHYSVLQLCNTRMWPAEVAIIYSFTV